MKNELD